MSLSTGQEGKRRHISLCPYLLVYKLDQGGEGGGKFGGGGGGARRGATIHTLLNPNPQFTNIEIGRTTNSTQSYILGYNTPRNPIVIDRAPICVLLRKLNLLHPKAQASCGSVVEP